MTHYLWDTRAPGAIADQEEDKPSLQVFLPSPDKATGTGIVICPGGAYVKLVSSYEGEEIARWLNKIGVAAFVLKYRFGPRYYHPAPLNDASRAIRYVRYHSKEFGVAPDRIGIIGFSAGGHLASTAITLYDMAEKTKGDPVDSVSARPDFAILGYPIISLYEPYTHPSIAPNLIGPNPSAEMRDLLSSHKHVTSQTPPTFLFHTNEDSLVKMENSEFFYSALRKAGVPAEMHIYDRGQHGIGLADGVNGAMDVPSFTTWPILVEHWLHSRDFLGPSKDKRP